LEFVGAVSIVHDKVEKVNDEVRGVRGLVRVACEASHGRVPALGALAVIRENEEKKRFSTTRKEVAVTDGNGVLLEVEKEVDLVGKDSVPILRFD